MPTPSVPQLRLDRAMGRGKYTNNNIIKVDHIPKVSIACLNILKMELY